MRKLPYIPDKDLYAAVMFACKMIREGGYVNKSCKIAANYYNVDVEDVKKYVRFAQGIGQRLSNLKKPRKYHWYVMFYVPEFYGSEIKTIKQLFDATETRVIKATNYKNAESHLKTPISDREWYDMDSWDTTPLSFVYFGYPFDKQKDALEYQNNIDWEELKDIVKEIYEDKFSEE